MTIPLLDCHQHLIYPEKYPYSWTKDIPELAGKAFRMEDYLRLVDGRGPVRTIFMETSPDDPHWQTETQFVCELADQPNSIIDGLIINCRPEDTGDFEAYIESVQHPKLVGFRRILHVMPDSVSQQSGFVDNVRLLEKYDLTFDLCFLARQLPLAAALVGKCPGVQFVLDHCGVPDIAGGHLDPWRDDVRRLAELPNVACKISGVLAYCDPQSANKEAVRPYVEHCLECFGWERVVWGSDWPVCTITSGLPAWIDIAREIVADVDDADQHRLFHENAERIYLKR